MPSLRRELGQAVGAAIVAAMSAMGCGGAGTYGHAPRYVELGDEKSAAAGARDYDPVMAQRRPEVWRSGRVSLFGVVQSRAAGPGASARLKIAVRTLAPRNLCIDQTDDDSCRVTVSDKDFGLVTVLAALRPEDDVGPRSVAPGSLLRVIGTLGEDTSVTDGTSVLRAAWYRHWPTFYYVTQSSSKNMRQ